MFYRFKINN